MKSVNIYAAINSTQLSYCFFNDHYQQYSWQSHWNSTLAISIMATTMSPAEMVIRSAKQLNRESEITASIFLASRSDHVTIKRIKQGSEIDAASDNKNC